MRIATYTKYRGGLLASLNLEALLERLADFLLKGGFAGGPEDSPWWAGYDPDAYGDRTLEGLKRALLEALIESGQLTPEMLKELRGEGGDGEARRELAEMLDDLIQRLVDEGYLDVSSGSPLSGAERPVEGSGHVDEGAAAARQVEFELTRKGVDFLGWRTLRHLLGGMGSAEFGSHDTPHLATGVEAEAAPRPYRFGDALNLDIPCTLKNALERVSASAEPFELEYGDLMVNQAEYRSACATVLLLDVSHSMILYGEDRFTPAKKVALALSHLIRTQYPGDTLRVVTFGDRAEQIPLATLARAKVGPYHTNTAEGLRLARRMLLAQKREMRQIIMITDGKPSAITLPDGRVYKNPMGLDPRVLRETFREVTACRRAGIPINTFMLARDPSLVRFVAKVCELARGRAYFTTTMTLGQYVLRDYLRRTTRRG